MARNIILADGFGGWSAASQLVQRYSATDGFYIGTPSAGPFPGTKMWEFDVNSPNTKEGITPIVTLNGKRHVTATFSIRPWGYNSDTMFAMRGAAISNIQCRCGFIGSGLRFRDGAAWQYDIALGLNRWYTIELYVYSDASNGRMAARLDGQLLFDQAGLNTNPAGGYIYQAAPRPGGMHFSNWIVYWSDDDTTKFFPAPCYATYLKLDQNVSGNSTPTPAGSRAANIDDIGPDGESSYNSILNVGEVDLFKTSEKANIQGTIQGVLPYAIMRRETLGSNFLDLRIVDGASVADLVANETQLVSYSAISGQSLSRPAGGNYTANDFDNLQFGYVVRA